MYGPSHQNALELEVNVLSLLLRRNQCSHRRSKPFQHASMALRCLLVKSTHNTKDQAPNLQLFGASNDLLARAEEAVNRRRVKRRRQQVFWELASATDQEEDRHELRELTKLHGGIVWAIQLSNIQELFSRIDSAAAYLWSEIARGFFLPFMTVAVASLARIRILVLQLFVHVTDAVLPQALGLLRELGLDDDEAIQQQSIGNQQRSTVDEVRAFLSRQATIGSAGQTTATLRDDGGDMPSEDVSRIGNSAATNSIPRSSAEKKWVRNEARRARFLRELGLTPGGGGAATSGRVEVGNDVGDDEGVESNSNEESIIGTTVNRNVTGVPTNRSESDSLENFGGLDGEAEIALESGTRHDVKDDNGDATNASGNLGQRLQQKAGADLSEDRGESVTAAPASGSPTSTDLLAPTAAPQILDDGTLDKNLAWAERIGDEKKRKKAKASKKRGIDNDNGGGDKSTAQSTSTADGARASSKSKRPKATKKEKRQRDKDFFDDLFG
jgi:hypothetical protein